MTLPEHRSPAPESFRAAMQAAGLDYAGSLIADGALHRFRSGDDRQPNSWYVFHSSPPMAGAFGCWKRGIKENWCERNGQTLSRDEWQRADTERKQAEMERHAEAREEAAAILNQSTPASADHTYLRAKGVKVFGETRQQGGSLVLPLRDTDGTLHSLQFITADGTKRFLSGGRVAGTFFTLNDRIDGPLLICEGYATGASVHEATGLAIVCAMNCGNLGAVADALRAKWPAREIIIAADNDAWTTDRNANPWNPGIEAAMAAAIAISARLAVPQFKETSTHPTDFNDLHQLEGTNTVKEQIETATTPRESDEQVISRLAALSPLEFDRVAQTEAKAMGVKMTTLRSEVEKRRPKQHNAGSQDSPMEPADPEPWEYPVHGADLLEEIASTYRRFCVLPQHAAELLAVWNLQTFCYRQFQFAAIVAVWSPEPECGKGRVLDVTEALTCHPFRTANTSPAVLYHSVAKGNLTVLIDEFDSHHSEQRETIGNILKSGFQANGKAHRMAERNGEQVVVEFNTYCPKMIATVGMDTLDKASRTRAIGIGMQRKPRGAKLEKFRRFDGTGIRRKCLRWAEDNAEAILKLPPMEIAECATDRQEDVWEPLVGVARLAGGEWEARIRGAAAALSGKASEAAVESLGHQVLAAINDYFAASHTTRATTKELVEHLSEAVDVSNLSRGRGLSASLLARLLKPYSIESRNIKMPDGKVAKGYYRTDFAAAVSSYLHRSQEENPDLIRYAATKADNIERISDFADATTQPSSVSMNAIFTSKDGAGSGVADRIPETAGNESEEAVLL